MPRAKRPLCNRQIVAALIPHRRTGGWIYCINNSICFQRKPEEGTGITCFVFHDRSVLKWPQDGGIYLFDHQHSLPFFDSPVSIGDSGRNQSSPLIVSNEVKGFFANWVI